jgi:hypothetical protein
VTPPCRSRQREGGTRGLEAPDEEERKGWESVRTLERGKGEYLCRQVKERLPKTRVPGAAAVISKMEKKANGHCITAPWAIAYQRRRG